MKDCPRDALRGGRKEFQRHIHTKNQLEIVGRVVLNYIFGKAFDGSCVILAQGKPMAAIRHAAYLTGVLVSRRR